MSTQTAIRIENLTHIYSPKTAFEKTALDNINIEVRKGAFVGLIGHTGSGKSTLVQHLNALLKPSSGKIFIDDEDTADKERLKALRYKVGLVFQYPEHQLFEVTVAKDVAFGPKNMGLPPDEVDRRVKKALTLVGISEELYEKSPFELSGGQKRRVAIAGVLAMEPTILILDEPTAGLDPKGRDEILGRIKAMHEELAITVILVSHSMEDIAKLVEQIIVIHHGRIELIGSPSEVFMQIERLESLGLGSTATAYLADRLRQAGYNLPSGIYTVDEAVAAIAALLNEGGAQ